MHSYLIIHHTSQNFQVALFNNDQRIDLIIDDKRLVSKLLISFIDTILARNNCKLTDLAFIGINQGPGLFSTLRSIIATVNGLHFATSISLVGVDALDAMLAEYNNHKNGATIVLLDAFNHEVYYAIQNKNDDIKKGYKNINAFLDQLYENYSNQPITFVGNGAQLYHDLIVQKFDAPTSLKLRRACSKATEDLRQGFDAQVVGQAEIKIETIARQAYTKFLNKKNDNDYLLPLHLKKHPVEMQ
jgi:tRNA threonylcarbamoyl adenosine modification protein YeaZ